MYELKYFVEPHNPDNLAKMHICSVDDYVGATRLAANIMRTNEAVFGVQIMFGEKRLRYVSRSEALQPEYHI